MSDFSYLFIVNPVAGKNRGMEYIPLIKEICLANKIKHHIIKTEKIGGAAEVIKENILEPYDVYIAVGGDGTVNEVINGMIGSNKIFGIIPCGTGNDLAKTLLLPKDPKEAIMRTITSEPKQIDIGRVNGRYFANIASIGLDAEIANYSNKIKKWFKGAYAYIIALVKVLLTYKPMTIDFFDGEEAYTKKIMLVAFCNGKFYGGGMKIAPKAHISDGYLDICIIEKMHKLKLLVLFPSVFKGKHSKFKEVKIHRTNKITINSNHSSKINIDGEIIENHQREVTFEIVAKALNVLY